ncbi:MAG: AAA family ATPase [Pseudomonadales bacterium]|nr:AAA family ATPase [Pseudomonadales bacterium]
MKDANDLGLVLESQVPIILIESFEEDLALQLITRVGMKHKKTLNVWSVTDGLRPLGFSIDENDRGIDEPEGVLKAIKGTKQAGVYVLCDFHPYLSDEYPKNVRLLKDIALNYKHTAHTIILLSHAINAPPEIKRLCANFEMSLPNEEQIMSIIREEARDWSLRNRNAKIKTDGKTLQKIVHNLKGMTHGDVRRLARGLIIDDGAIKEDALPEINKAKFQLMDMEGVLSYEYDTQHFSNVGGLNNLKRWLKERESAFHGKEENIVVDKPKGILLLGVQGSGKSLAAKAVAGMWHLPLLRLDFGALYNKYFGETEKNLREAIKLAELMQPCVLWMDEIEKGMSTQGNDSGTSQRVLGTLLTWMAERTSSVFIVATSNDISGLPPELVRKGRLDEIFFVDLPEADIRREIFAIHLGKRNLNPDEFNVNELAEYTEGFSGAEIEQVVVAAVYRASARQETLVTQHLIEEINNTSPISVVMAEKIHALRLWAAERTVNAN